MEKIRLLFTKLSVAVVAVALLAGCGFDPAYDLSKLKEGDLVVGDYFEAPLGDVFTTIELLLGDDGLQDILDQAGLSLEDIGKEPMPVGDTYEFLIEFDAQIIEDWIVDLLTGTGTLKVELDAESTIPMPVEIETSFVDSYENPLVVLETIPLGTADPGVPAKNEVEIEITADMLSDIANAGGLKMVMNRTTAGDVVFNLDDYLKVKLVIIKTGGLLLTDSGKNNGED